MIILISLFIISLTVLFLLLKNPRIEENIKIKKVEIYFSDIMRLKDDFAFQKYLIKRLILEGFDLSKEIKCHKDIEKNALIYEQKE